MTERYQEEATTRMSTEARNRASVEIDQLSSREIVQLMNAEDASVAAAVGKELDAISSAVDVIADRIRRGGRLIYLGAGTSGRLGVLDASECPPTFSTPPSMVVGLIAGGQPALTRAVERAEDDPESGERALREVELTGDDAVVGIATSGRTPYVIGGLQYAKRSGAFAIGLACNAESALDDCVDLMITPVVGPEVITGSTRLKAGTATKMVLNMLTTGSMIRLGKTYDNLMVDLTATNKKLLDRSRRIVQELTGLEARQASELLDQCDGEVKTAVVMHHRRISAAAARLELQAKGGHLRRTLEEG